MAAHIMYTAAFYYRQLLESAYIHGATEIAWLENAGQNVSKSTVSELLQIIIPQLFTVYHLC